jgi:hypothetical protein
VDGQGFTRVRDGKPNARVATGVQREGFLDWFVARLAPTPAVSPSAKPPVNVAALVERGGLPNQVHVIEDYETDIERRWWLCGLPEPTNIPSGSRRACRGVWTNDFDDRMGDPRAMYTAVIFNPVPGPPMGPNTRLSFRYWLKGTDNLRVQIYSLSRGYHRCLTLTNLPRERWQAATVDLTAARRPDGSGGPLAEGERIDDIQFYADPAAELYIDDIVLHDGAPPGETRRFPTRPIFTGWFDTGRPGREWPGDFEIVPRPPPQTGKAARSVPDALTGSPCIGLHLRGKRPLGETTALRFHYYLTGTSTLRVLLLNEGRIVHAGDLKALRANEWAEATLSFPAKARPGGKDPAGPERVDEIRFFLPKEAALLVDDVLLYEPGGSATGSSGK